jgi:hypothetical protein
MLLYLTGLLSPCLYARLAHVDRRHRPDDDQERAKINRVRRTGPIYPS